MDVTYVPAPWEADALASAPVQPDYVRVFYVRMASAERLLRATETYVRRRYRDALVVAQSADCALCGDTIRFDSILGSFEANLENVSGTLAEDAADFGLGECKRLPYMYGGCVALHYSCNQAHANRRAWMHENNVSHERLTSIAWSLRNVRG